MADEYEMGAPAPHRDDQVGPVVDTTQTFWSRQPQVSDLLGNDVRDSPFIAVRNADGAATNRARISSALRHLSASTIARLADSARHQLWSPAAQEESTLPSAKAPEAAARWAPVKSGLSALPFHLRTRAELRQQGRTFPVCGAVCDHRRIENNQIRSHSGPNQAAVEETEPPSRRSSHVLHGCL